MTIREYAKSVGFEVVGKLKRLPDEHWKGTPTIGASDYRMWIDEAGNVYEYRYNNHNHFCIITADDGTVI